MDHLEIAQWALWATPVVNLSILCWNLYLLKRIRRYIGSLSTDATRAQRINPEVVEVWQQKIRKLTPGSTKYKAYAASLRNVGISPDGHRYGD